MKGEDLALGVFCREALAWSQGDCWERRLTIGVLEQDLPVNTTWSDKGWVECVDFVGRHDDLDVTTIIETIKLVQQLQHGALNLTLASRGGIVSLGTDSIDLVDKDDTGSVLGSDLEELPD